MKNAVIMDSPVGRLMLEQEDGMLCAVRMAKEGETCPREATTLLSTACFQLEAYFAGERTSFDLPLAARGTAFERRVWKALEAIPYGQTRTYGQIAAAIGQPLSCRAVGRACGANPLLILVPCHRVIGASGALTGFAAGTKIKRMLLCMEGISVR